MTISPDFSITFTDNGGGPALLDGDFALITASPGGVSGVPEPGTWILFGAGFLALMFLRFKNMRVFGKISSLKSVRPLVLMAACAVLIPSLVSAATTVRLSQTTSPGSGVAGSSDVWITGNGFPGGTVTPGSTTVTLTTTCGGTADATTLSLAVRQIVGTTDRVEFEVPGILAAGTYFASISGTTSTGNAFTSTCSTIQVTRSSTTFSSCNPGSSIGMVVPAAGTGVTPVTAYVPNAAWDKSTTGVRVVPIEGAGALASISTANPTNSCSSDSSTGETVCTANNTDIYLITGTTLTGTLTSGADAEPSFSGGSCFNCGVAVNAVRHQAVIQVGLSTSPSQSGLQFLDLTTNTLGTPIPATKEVSENILWDPLLSLVLSPNEGNNYDLFQVSTPLGVVPSPATVTENTNPMGTGGEPDSAGEDCSTGIALSTVEFTGELYLADLKQATFTPGTPGTWTAPSQVQNFPEFEAFGAGTSGIAVAPGTTHLGVVADEFGGNTIGVIQLPATSGPGAGIPAVVDYAYATLPMTPDGNSFSNGDDPHTTTAYTSPNNGKAYGVAASWATGQPLYLAIIDIQALLNAPRTTGTHTVDPSYDLLANGVVRYVITQ